MFQAIFNGALSGRGEVGRFCRRLRRWILKWSDPLVTWQLNGRELRLRLSHQLPFYRREFPTYSANLERLGAFLHRQYGRLVMIDVGANVGDSLALAGIRPGDACLLIEGDPEYLKLLRENTADLPEAICVGAMLSDQVGQASVQLVPCGGTGQIISARGMEQVALQTLDGILDQQPRFKESQLLKSDVDGYDFRVLRGGARFLRASQPILFFEQDPRLLDGVGEDPDQVWEWLAATGYTQVFVYDNLGYWLGSFPLQDLSTLRQLNHYARPRTGVYYDVAAFGPRHEAIQQAFAAEEKAFYDALGRMSQASPRPGP